jgi:hypothetical protein
MPHRGVREVLTLFLLLTGVPMIVGWVTGAVLLLRSPLWTTPQKVLGLLVWPGGMRGVILILDNTTTTPAAPGGFGSGSFLLHPVAMWVLAGVSFLVMVYLWLTAGRAPRRSIELADHARSTTGA